MIHINNHGFYVSVYDTQKKRTQVTAGRGPITGNTYNGHANRFHLGAHQSMMVPEGHSYSVDGEDDEMRHDNRVYQSRLNRRG